MAKIQRLLQEYRIHIISVLLLLLLASFMVPEEQGNPAPWATPPGAYKQTYSDVPGNYGDLNDVEAGGVAPFSIMFRNAGNDTWIPSGNATAANMYLKWDGTTITWGTVSGGGGGTFDPTTVNGATTWGNSTEPTHTWTWDLSAGTDPAMSMLSAMFSFTASLNPSADDTYSLGNSTHEWKDGNFDGTLEADTLTEGGQAVYNASETPGGELGGTWASPTVDSGIHDDEYVELGDNFVGDVTGTYDATVVGDDSHAHTTTTISGLDISADTNLTAGDHITLTDDDLDVDDDFLLNTGDAGTGVYDFGGADSLEGVNGTNPTVNAEGEFAFDTNDGKITYYADAQQWVVGGNETEHFDLAFPDLLQAESDNWFLFSVNNSEFPHGIEIVKVELWTSTTSSYSLVVEGWNTATTHSFDIETIATSTSTHASSTSIDTSTIPVDTIIMADLPTDDLSWVGLEITYYVIAGD